MGKKLEIGRTWRGWKEAIELTHNARSVKVLR